MAPKIFKSNNDYDNTLALEQAMYSMKKRDAEKKRQEHLDAMLAEWRKENGYCPHCGDSYYQYLHSTSTLMGWTPVYKDGVLVNKNPNKTTKHFRCLNCGNNFSHTI